MAYSTQRAVSPGGMTYLDLSISYIKRADINVFYNGLPAGAGTWAWVGTTDKRITFSPAIAAGVEVLVKRTTQINGLINVFANGAKFNNATMDQDFTQLLYLNQEAVEGAALTDIFNDVDFHGYKIKNLGLAVDDTDAITFGQLKTMNTGAYNAQIAAEAARDLAALWATKLTTTVDGTSYSAKQYALNSTSSATASAGSATASANSAAAALASKNAAATSEGNSWANELASQAAATLAQAWASQVSGFVNGTTSYSAAYNAAQAAAWATQLTTTVDGTSYSAKQYALNAAASASASAASAALSNSALSTFTADIRINKTTPLAQLNDTSGANYGDVRYMNNGVLKWALRGYAAGNFLLNRYDASGTLIDSPISVDTSTGVVQMVNGVNNGGSRLLNVATPTATTDGANKAYVDATAGRSLGVTTYRTAGTFSWTRNAATKKARFKLCGAGGSGGGVAATSASTLCAGGGGGSGGEADFILTAAQLDAITTGAFQIVLGAGGASVSGSSAAGGNSTFGTAGSPSAVCGFTGGSGGPVATPTANSAQVNGGVGGGIALNAAGAVVVSAKSGAPGSSSNISSLGWNVGLGGCTAVGNCGASAAGGTAGAGSGNGAGGTGSVVGPSGAAYGGAAGLPAYWSVEEMT